MVQYFLYNTYLATYIIAFLPPFETSLLDKKTLFQYYRLGLRRFTVPPTEMEVEAASSIYSLPDEIIVMILKRTSYADCNSFRRTCKRYNHLIKYCHSLWRVIYHKTVGKVIYNITAEQSTGDWWCDLRQYLTLKNELIDLIANMSSNHFSEFKRDISLESSYQIFVIALSNSTNYYFTLTILQNFIQAAIKRVNTLQTKTPYTLTEIHYGKMVVRYLVHALFMLKWVHHLITNQLTPEIVINFFTQWLDPVHMHRDEEVLDLIKDMVRDVDRLLLEPRPSGRLPGVGTLNACTSGVYSEKQVLLAISHYMYKQRRMVLMTACNQDTLDIVKTIKSNSGHGACLGAIFQAIARGFGITSCALIAFPNHMYLQWRDNKGFKTVTMQFSLDTGELRPQGRCPFSGNINPMNRVIYKYSAESLMQYLISNFIQHMGDYKGWHTDNAVHLLDFISDNGSSQYCNFLPHLRALKRVKLTKPFNIEYIHEDHLEVVRNLLHLNKTPKPRCKDVVLKQHTSAVQYSVGLICFHKVFDYVCVIRGWDWQCAPEYRGRPESVALEHGTTQPFYHITAIDQSDRYVAQENLILLPNPSRIYHLEDAIAKEFTHFNGFFYEPNAEKQALYPGDMAIGKMYAAKYFALRIPSKVRRY